MKNEGDIIGKAVRALEGSFVYLSKNKFGSHVVEKLLKYADDELVNLMIKEIIFDQNDPNNFLEIAQHPFGNYVLQTALGRSKVRTLETRYSHILFLV